MTNAELVREINRMIRGVALNYPSGLPEIRRQLEALEPTVRRRPEDTVSVGKGPLHTTAEQWKPAGIAIHATGGTPTTFIPAADIHPEQPKRKPGRPKGSKNTPKDAA